MLVLIVDDYADTAQTLCDVLRSDGHCCWVASSGKAALSFVEQLKPQVAIVEVWLPDVSGYELARRLRAKLTWPLYLVALTTASDSRARALAAGFDVHLSKPATAGELRRVIAAARTAGAAQSIG